MSEKQRLEETFEKSKKEEVVEVEKFRRRA
jgi:hypothetical protein